jgi:hypothetical protein
MCAHNCSRIFKPSAERFDEGKKIANQNRIINCRMQWDLNTISATKMKQLTSVAGLNVHYVQLCRSNPCY